jgi:hypothetical protein
MSAAQRITSQHITATNSTQSSDHVLHLLTSSLVSPFAGTAHAGGSTIGLNGRRSIIISLMLSLISLLLMLLPPLLLPLELMLPLLVLQLLPLGIMTLARASQKGIVRSVEDSLPQRLLSANDGVLKRADKPHGAPCCVSISDRGMPPQRRMSTDMRLFVSFVMAATLVLLVCCFVLLTLFLRRPTNALSNRQQQSSS